MAYIEYLRMRKRVVIVSILVALLGLLVVVASAGHTHVEVNGSEKSLAAVVPGLPLSLFLGIAGFITSILAAFLASLNSLSDTLPSVWTKPVSRERMALSIFGVDALGLVVCYVACMAITLAVLAGIGVIGKLYVDSLAPAIAFLGIGTSYMAYGNVQALTAWNLNRGGTIAGILWGSYLILLILSVVPLPPLFHGIASTLDIVNPYAYFGTISVHGSEATSSAMFGFSAWVRAAIVFAFAIAGCAIATFSWKRMEI